MIRRDAWEVYSKALAVSLAVYFVNRLVEREFERVFHDRVFCWAAAFGAVQIGVILVLSLSLLAARTYARFTENLHDQIRPAIRDRVSALAFEGESWSSVVPRRGLGRKVLEDSIAQTLATVRAAGRERVGRFAMHHGFAAQWTKELWSKSKDDRKRAVFLLGLLSPVAGSAVLAPALEDKQAAVRAEAYRALLIEGDPLSVERVFQSVLKDSLLMRALLADDLKRHAGYLLAHTIPQVLEQATAAEAARCFEILIAWKRALPSFDIRPWLSVDREASLVPLVLALLPYVMTDDAIDDFVGAAIKSGNLDVQCAAAHTAGRLRLRHLIPELEALLQGEKRVGLAGAAAMGEMGEAGVLSLEKIVVGADRKAAAVALEALEHLTVRSR